MSRRSLSLAKNDQGFTLIELLVVILIIGILAAIAIPAFLAQKSKGYDASAKEMARTASLAAETYGTDHNGEYSGLTAAKGPEILHEYENAIQLKGPNAYLTEAESIEAGRGFTVTATSPVTKDTFTVVRKGNGELSRTCKSEKTGCSGAASGSW